MLQARLDCYAAAGVARGWPARSTTAVRRLIDTCDLFEWDLERAEHLTDAVGMMFGPGSE